MTVTYDITELVKADHHKVEGLFHQIEGADTTIKNSVFLQIRQELELHLSGEEEVMYPRTEAFKELEELTQDSVEDHQDVRSLLEQISAISSEEEEWDSLVRELKNCVFHHVNEEETKLLPRMKELMSQDELTRLGFAFEHSKSGMKLAG